jgi:hypothetical protein
LAHMAQVRPLACKLALVTWARIMIKDNKNPVRKNTFFMVIILKVPVGRNYQLAGF